jgi:hypothetical protein
MNKIMLLKKQITGFQTLYKKRFGKEISREEAYEQGAKLIRLIELIYKPMAEEIQKLDKTGENWRAKIKRID